MSLASQVAREHGEVIEPQDLIPVLEAEMVERFGKYDIGEARPTVKTLDSSLSAPARRSPVSHDPEDQDSLIEQTIKGLQLGEHLRE